MRAAQRLVMVAAVGAGFGALDSAVNAASSPYSAIGGRLAGTGWATLLRFLSFVLDAGWAWAALAVAAGCSVGGRARSAVAGGIVLVAAATFYYGADSWFLDESYSLFLPELRNWVVAGVILGALLGLVGAKIGRRGVVGLIAGLVVPVGAAVQMLVMPPGLGGANVSAEAVWARWIVWVAAAMTAVLVLARHIAGRRIEANASGGLQDDASLAPY